MATFSVVAQDGKFYGPVGEDVLVEWVQQGRVIRETVLHCHDNNSRVTAASVPALQPMLGLSQHQVNQLLQPVPHMPVAQPPNLPGAAVPRPFNLQYFGGPQHPMVSSFPTAAAVLLSIFVPLFAFIYYGLVHGNLPKRRPDDPGAGKAIGFMFIPFFNIYWGIFFWVRLCTRLNDELARVGLAPTAPRGLVVAICWCYLGLLIPVLNILVAIAMGVMMIVACVGIQNSVNSLARATGNP